MTDYTQMNEYDVFVRSPGTDQSARPYSLATDLASAKRFLANVRLEGKWGYIVPTRYRKVDVSAVEATRLALAALRELIGVEGEIFSDLDGPAEAPVWWQVQDYKATEEHREPGTRSICIDKLDGQVVPPNQQTLFYSLSARE